MRHCRAEQKGDTVCFVWIMEIYGNRGANKAPSTTTRESAGIVPLSLSLLRARIYIRRERDGCKESVSQEVARKGW